MIYCSYSVVSFFRVSFNKINNMESHKHLVTYLTLPFSMDMVTYDKEDPFLAADELALQDLMGKKRRMVKTVARWRSMLMVK